VPPENNGGMRRLMRRAVEVLGMSVLAWAGLAASPSRAYAIDPFEIQVYDGTANPVGVPGLELHLNDWATGNRQSEQPPEAPLNGQIHETLEPSYGLTPFWELGAYVEFAQRTDDGVADWAGVKLRSKFVTPPGWDAHWRLGVNLELSYLPATYDASRWGSEIRPIVAWHDEHWLFAVNPIVDQSLAGPGFSDGPDFEPAAKVARTVGPVALGFEYYASLGPIAGFVPWRDQLHQLFECLDVLSLPHVEVNFGVGEGLTASSEGLVVKAILGYTWEKETAPPPMGAELAPHRLP